MLILLPPSETKTRPGTDTVPSTGRGYEPTALALPRLTDARQTVLRAVTRTAAGRGAAQDLGVPASAPELVERMAQLEDEPVGSPLRVYSGVLYEQLGDVAALGPDRRVLIQSALAGVVDAAHDAIPAYRLSATSRISRLGGPRPGGSHASAR